MSSTRSRHYYQTLLVLLGGSLLFLFAACGSNTPTTTVPKTTPTATSQTTPATTPTTVPTQTVQLDIKFSCTGPKDGVTIENGRGKVCVRTQPGAALTITVKYCNTFPDTSSALQGTAIADLNGFHEWDWSTPTTCGNQPIWKIETSVTATFLGQTKTITSVGQA